jgi:hypothetical protein
MCTSGPFVCSQQMGAPTQKLQMKKSIQNILGDRFKSKGTVISTAEELKEADFSTLPVGLTLRIEHGKNWTEIKCLGQQLQVQSFAVLEFSNMSAALTEMLLPGTVNPLFETALHRINRQGPGR